MLFPCCPDREFCKRSPASHIRPFSPSRIAPVCFKVKNEQVSVDSESKALVNTYRPEGHMNLSILVNGYGIFNLRRRRISSIRIPSQHGVFIDGHHFFLAGLAGIVFNRSGYGQGYFSHFRNFFRRDIQLLQGGRNIEVAVQQV